MARRRVVPLLDAEPDEQVQEEPGTKEANEIARDFEEAEEEDKEWIEKAETYIINKAEAKKYGDVADALNKELKKHIQENDMEPIKTDEGTVSVSVREKTVFDETGLVILFEESGKKQLEDLVIIEKHIDFEKLESLLYKNKLSEELMTEIQEDYTSKQQTYVLNIKKPRKGK